MPRKHPTGVMVQTYGEFFSAEAKAEGKGRSGGEVMTEHLDSMDDEARVEGERLRADIEGANRRLLDYDQGGDPEDRLGFAQVIDILDAGYQHSFSTSGGYLLTVVRMLDGTAKIFGLSWTSFSGSFYEPPDYDEACAERTRDEAVAQLAKLTERQDAPTVARLQAAIERVKKLPETFKGA
jgi:hypothetical protein